MPYYRLYHLNPQAGGIARFDEFEVEDDRAAEKLAEAKLNAHVMELWQQHRKVRSYEPRRAVGGEPIELVSATAS